MMRLKLLSAAALLTLLAVAPSLAADARIPYHRHHYQHAHRYWLPYDISYLHNYGPGLVAGTFAYYDGPSTNHCWQGSANYLGQDRRIHPCF
jgi:hypothetical protein